LQVIKATDNKIGKIINKTSIKLIKIFKKLIKIVFFIMSNN